MCDESGSTSESVQVKEPTVGENFDAKIKDAREEVLRLCTAKAKAEVLQVLDWPMSQVTQLLW